MAHPAFSIFSQHCDPEATREALCRLMPAPEVSHHDSGEWSQIVGTWKRGWFKKPLTLTATHNPDYYAGEDWPTQLAGMAGYFGKFPEDGRRAEIFGYLPGLCFALGFKMDPDAVENDPRESVIFEMARRVQGVIFVPGCLLDAEGRAILSIDGDIDPDASIPDHIPAENAPSPAGLDLVEDIPEDATGEPPTAERVAARLQVLAALVGRGDLETLKPRQGEPERERLVNELRETPAWQELEMWEKEALERHCGGLDQKRARKLPWLAEGAAVLAWAFRLVRLPAYDEQVDHDTVQRAALKLADSARLPSLREPSELKALSSQLLAIHWRLRQFSLDHQAMDFAEYAPRAWCGPMDLTLARLSSNDLEVGGFPLAQCPEQYWRIAGGIMEERRIAIEWLLGDSTFYSEVDTST